MGVRQMVSRVAAAGLLAAVAALTPATAAQAAPTGCSAWSLNGAGHATCTGGTGTVWVKVTCITVGGIEWRKTGPRVAVGQVSSVPCQLPKWSVMDVGFGTSD